MSRAKPVNLEASVWNAMKRFLRRNGLRIVIYGGIAGCLFDATLIEPHWLKVSTLRLSDQPVVRIVHISDLHFKGDTAYLRKVVRVVNGLPADIVCFTGDIVEDTRYLGDALKELSEIKMPLYGVPGNHEYWSGASFDLISQCFESTGGGWLADHAVVTLGGRLQIVGKSGTEIDTHRAASEFAMPGRRIDWTPAPNTTVPPSPSLYVDDRPTPALGAAPSLGPTGKRILLTHYPAVVGDIKGETYDLILAGHSHGGQIRLPFVGALIVPYGVNGYQKGLYATLAGPLHVSSGLGTFFLPLRFFCRPEITVFEI